MTTSSGFKNVAKPYREDINNPKWKDAAAAYRLYQIRFTRYVFRKKLKYKTVLW